MMDRARVEDEIAEAHRRDVEFCKSHFDLGSAFAHCERLKSYAGPALLAALAAGEVAIDMPSEYHAPRFVFRERPTCAGSVGDERDAPTDADLAEAEWSEAAAEQARTVAIEDGVL